MGGTIQPLYQQNGPPPSATLPRTVRLDRVLGWGWIP
jgi:hypothetical protein